MTDGDPDDADDGPATQGSGANTTLPKMNSGVGTPTPSDEASGAPEPPSDPDPEPGGFGAGAPDDQEMPLTEHIEEMVRRLAVVIVVMAIVSAITFPFADRLINFLWYSFLPGSPTECVQTAAAAAGNLTNGSGAVTNGTLANVTGNGTLANGSLNATLANATGNATLANGSLNATLANATGNATLANGSLNATAATGACPRLYHPLSLVLSRLKVASLAGFVIALPVFVYETYLFMRPGLYPNERRYYLASVPTSLILAIVGILFAFFLVLPVIFTYFLGYSQPVADIAFGLSETFNLILLMLGMFAFIFQIPLFVMLAIMMGVTSRRWLEGRRIFFWMGFAGLAFLFSPDPTGMAPFIVAVTMVVLFEGTLLLLRWTGR
jgi:sec-independent protein translocase protein TatC